MDLKSRIAEITAKYQQAAKVAILKEILTDLKPTTALPCIPANLWISFNGLHPQAVIPESVPNPERVTIVLEHQFWDVDPQEDKFTVGLKFSGTYFQVEVPYDSIIAVQDFVNEIAFDMTPTIESNSVQVPYRSSEFYNIRDRLVESLPKAQEGNKVVSLADFKKKIDENDS